MKYSLLTWTRRTTWPKLTRAFVMGMRYTMAPKVDFLKATSLSNVDER
jgi:hypothetical protein